METLIDKAREAIKNADAILIGASNGLSISEGYNIFADNEMFRQQFGDFREKYGIRSVLDGVFSQNMTAEDHQLFINRLVRLWIEEYEPSKVMRDLRKIIGNKPYFILTTNADEHLEAVGFETEKVWEIEGTFSNSRPINRQESLNQFLQTYDDKNLVILELGIGSRNRLIKLPLMQLAMQEPQATYITLNLPNEIYIPREIASKSIALPGDIANTLNELK